MQGKLLAGMIRNWSRMASGTSYWHGRAAPGTHYKPGVLAGYYRDFSGKTDWVGPQDERGLPLVNEPGCAPFHHPTTIAQKALGHWDRWLSSGRTDAQQIQAFLDHARWLTTAQEDQGSWVIPFLRKPPFVVPYSALAQGLATSVLTRAHTIEPGMKHLASARRAIEFMLRPVSDGGTARHLPNGMALEEFVTEKPKMVLNGWISALFGLYDHCRIDRSHFSNSFLEPAISALQDKLPRYDCSYWSCYDVQENVASPYYHRLHIVQLGALELTFPAGAETFSSVRHTFRRYASSRICRTRAVLKKGYQKVRQPPAVVFVQGKAPPSGR